MKFDEILPLMREGKKARIASNNEGEYWISGYQGFDFESRVRTIIRMDKDNRAPLTTYDWGIARWMIMSEDWVVCEEQV